MSFNTNAPFNARIRAAGNRSRMLPGLPDIGQNAPLPQPASPTSNTPGFTPPGPQASALPPQPPGATANAGPALPPLGPPAGQAPGYPMGTPGPAPANMASPMRAPTNINPQTFTVSPAGSAADSGQYNYEPQPDGSWRVYPPGVAAPPHTIQASMPRAASTADYIRMSQAFSAGPPQPSGQAQYPQPMQAPTTNQFS